MRCLLKLAVAVCVAVIAQFLVQPGGVGDECVFAARVYVGAKFFGVPPESPEMVDAAARLSERQANMSEAVRQIRQWRPPVTPDCEELAEAADGVACAATAATPQGELACTR